MFLKSKWKIVKLLFTILLIPLLLGYFEVFYTLVFDFKSIWSLKHKIFSAGMAAYLPFYIIFFRKKSSFLETFEHELTHILFAKLFFKKTDKFFASAKQGGYVVTEGDNFLIALAPYFFPTLSFVLLLFKFIIREDLFQALLALIGFSLSYHIVSTIKEFRPRQTDIKGQGYIFSTIFIFTAIFFFYGIVLSFSLDGYEGLKDFILSGYEASKGWYLLISHELNINQYLDRIT